MPQRPPPASWNEEELEEAAPNEEILVGNVAQMGNVLPPPKPDLFNLEPEDGQALCNEFEAIVERSSAMNIEVTPLSDELEQFHVKKVVNL